MRWARRRRETTKERLQHTMYDALKWLDIEADTRGEKRYAETSRAILRSGLMDYPPYLAYREERGVGK